jgi:CheY-like chemotaxis protein
MGSRNRTLRILVLEDDPTLQDFYLTTLRSAGFSVAIVPDGLEAIHRVDDDPPAAIILDLRAPRLSGRDVRRELASHLSTRNVPILVISGKRKALNPAEFPCVLREPITADALLRAVHDCLHAQNQQKD